MLSLHTAAIGEEMGRNMLTIDTDPQGTLTMWKKRSQEASLPGPMVEMMPSRQLLEELPELRRKHDCIVVDTPPLATIELFRIIKDADYALVPITPGGFELDALQSLLAIVPLDRTRIILNRATSSNATTTTRRALNKLSLPVSVVRDYAAFRSVSLYGGTVLSKFSTGNAALDIRRLGRELWS